MLPRFMEEILRTCILIVVAVILNKRMIRNLTCS